MTNREVLARKSNEELVEWLAAQYNDCGMCAYVHYSDECNNYACANGIQQWLEQETKDDE